MRTDCTLPSVTFQGHRSRRVEAAFDGGHVSSDAGAVLLREADRVLDLSARASKCFNDLRRPYLIEFTVRELVAQRVIGLALGYEDLIDHDALRTDRAVALAVGRYDINGLDRQLERDRGMPLAGKSTLNRLELSAEPATRSKRYHKILSDFDALDELLLDLFVERHDAAPDEVVLDLDATDFRLHGNQEDSYFNAFYERYCYLPLYVVAGDFPLCVRLRPSNQSAAAGCVEELARIVERLRLSWPNTRFIVRGDSGYGIDDLMSWCEQEDVDYVLGLQRNSRLVGLVSDELKAVSAEFEETGLPTRSFRDLEYRTRTSWSRARRVVAKCEQLVGKQNPRFVVTSLAPNKWDATALYEQMYCQRGDMENRIKEHQLELFADRMSTQVIRPNQLRVYFSTLAYILILECRRIGLTGTELETAQPKTIRRKLFKIGARVLISVRRVKLSMASACPWRELFLLAAQRVARPGPHTVTSA